jgi:PKD repeat protein
MQKRMYGIQGTDFKGFGVGHQDASVMIGGTFHNSTLLMNGEVFTNGWVSTVIGGSGGDNTRGFVNPGIKNQVYFDKSGSRGRVVLPDSRNQYYKLFDFEKQPNASYSVGNSCNLAFHPRYYYEILSGVSDQLWRTKDNGSSWELIRDFNGGKIVQIEQSIRNPNLIYVVQLFGTQNQNTKLWKSDDAGQSWDDVSPGFPSYSYYPFQVSIHSQNDQTVYLARLSQYANSSSLDGEKVYISDNGANSWSNISGSNLNGELLTNMVHQKGSDGFYLGTRRAVYYIDNSLSEWELYNNNMPVSTFSTKLVPSYSTEKIINATNRGVFESPFNNVSAPIAIPSLQQQVIECVLDTAFFGDMSVLSGVNSSWNWSFPGGTPASSNNKSPKVVYSEPGNYTVTLQVSDQNGSSSTTVESMVTVLPNCSILGVPGKALSLNGSGGHMETSPINETLTEMTIMAWIKPDGFQQGTVSIAHWQGPAGNATGLYLDQSNQLKFQWAGSHLSFNSELFASPDKWSHVALVIKANQANLYLNGRSSSKPVNISNFNFNDPMLTGINATSIGPGYNGLIDELSIWNHAKTTSEVRLQRHLSILDNTRPHLLSYFQFNTDPGYIPDLVGDADGYLISGATLSNSNGPFGEGISQEKMINSAGNYNFDLPMVDLQIGPGQTPNGSVVINRLNIQPDILPQGSPPYSEAYWIINNYGSNIDFEALGLIQFNNIGFVSTSEAMTPEMIMLFKRQSNDAGVDWGMPVDMADLAIPGALGSAGFSNSITTFSQFVISRNVIVPVELISFKAEKHRETSALVSWKTGTEVNLSHFEIERSWDGRRFHPIAEIMAKAFSVGAEENYEFIDNSPGQTNIYYRLKSLDFDGGFQYSDIRSLDFSNKEITLKLFPNPVKQGQNIHMLSAGTQHAKFILFNASGQLIEEMSLEANHQFSTESLPSGSYYYILTSDTQKRSGTIIIQ